MMDWLAHTGEGHADTIEADRHWLADTWWFYAAASTACLLVLGLESISKLEVTWSLIIRALGFGALGLMFSSMFLGGIYLLGASVLIAVGGLLLIFAVVRRRLKASKANSKTGGKKNE